MHTGTLKKLALGLVFWLALHGASLKAQIFTAPLQASTTGTDPVDFEFRADGTMIAKGNFGVGSLEDGDQGDGTRLLWFPSLGAFRAGTVNTGLALGNGPWDTANIGQYSTAFGYNNTAYGQGSTALGAYNTASGENTVAMGMGTLSNSWVSTAMGAYTTAAGPYSTSSGLATTASGYASTTTGVSTVATGDYSSASGLSTLATACLDYVVGTYNIGGGSETEWVDTDPLFEIGNGTSTTPSDAVVVYKNGNAQFQGTVRCSPGGDLSMGTFTAGVAP